MVADMVADMEVHMVADMKVDKVADMVADMKVDKVADMVADMVANMSCFNSASGRGGWFIGPKLFSSRSLRTRFACLLSFLSLVILTWRQVVKMMHP